MAEYIIQSNTVNTLAEAVKAKSRYFEDVAFGDLHKYVDLLPKPLEAYRFYGQAGKIAGTTMTETITVQLSTPYFDIAETRGNSPVSNETRVSTYRFQLPTASYVEGDYVFDYSDFANRTSTVTVNQQLEEHGGMTTDISNTYTVCYYSNSDIITGRVYKQDNLYYIEFPIGSIDSDGTMRDYAYSYGGHNVSMYQAYYYSVTTSYIEDFDSQGEMTYTPQDGHYIDFPNDIPMDNPVITDVETGEVILYTSIEDVLVSARNTPFKRFFTNKEYTSKFYYVNYQELKPNVYLNIRRETSNGFIIGTFIVDPYNSVATYTTNAKFEGQCSGSIVLSCTTSYAQLLAKSSLEVTLSGTLVDGEAIPIDVVLSFDYNSPYTFNTTSNSGYTTNI